MVIEEEAGSGEMAQWLTVLAALPEAVTPIPSSHILYLSKYSNT